jgi:hypothetical protein
MEKYEQSREEKFNPFFFCVKNMRRKFFPFFLCIFFMSTRERRLKYYNHHPKAGSRPQGKIFCYYLKKKLLKDRVKH